MNNLKLLEKNETALVGYLVQLRLYGQMPVLDNKGNCELKWTNEEAKKAYEEGVEALTHVRTSIMKERGRATRISEMMS